VSNHVLHCRMELGNKKAAGFAAGGFSFGSSA
jgi:hypothetical protein